MATIEEKILEQYGGRGTSSLPQTLMFDHVSPATRLLEKRRQMFEVQEALNSQKEEFSRREDAFRRREDGLRRKDLELQDSLIKFNKFLQENESKRNRALKRATEERKQRELKEQEIERLEAQLRSKLKEETILKEELEKNLKYQDYLDNVVQTMSKFFPEIPDILNRFKTLRDANSYLIEKHSHDEAAFDNTQKDFGGYKKSKENQVLNDGNTIAERQVLLEQGESRANRVQEDVDKQNMDASQKGLELGQILASVSNILERADQSFRIRHNKPPVERSLDNSSDMKIVEKYLRAVSKLDEVEMFMVDYRDIIQHYTSSAQGEDNRINRTVSGTASISPSLNTSDYGRGS